MAVDVFALPVFLIVFRETLETVIIVSVLLAFLKQTLGKPGQDAAIHKKLVRQVWLGTGLGFLLCLIIGAAIIGVFYTVGKNHWESSELIYEGVFALIASIIITFVGAALLRIGKMQDKWRVKLAQAIESSVTTKTSASGRIRHFAEKYAMFVLPFITVLREGIEAIVFVAGVSFSASATAIPLPTVVGLIFGSIVGYIIYKGGSTSRLQIFLVLSTCLLYLVAAGLFSRAVWSFEMNDWAKVVGGDGDELGDGPGSYDVDKSVWHVNCCNPQDGYSGWGVFNAILGWTNSATYGSVLSYNLYWIAVIIGFVLLRYNEVTGHWPLQKPKTSTVSDNLSQASGSDPEIKGKTTLTTAPESRA